ncbi:MAG: AraC family transcriptional regulator [Gammaproteobacteria bacterium]|nr:AraC family transcriptional regulator [Gammaproteobacteria bacterium]
MVEHPPHRIVFSSDALPKQLGERRRRTLWRDVYTDLYGPLEMTFAEDPFSVRLEVARFGAAELAAVNATIERYIRTPRCVAAARSDHLALAVNAGVGPMHVRQLGRDCAIAPGGAALVCNATSGEIAARAGSTWLFLQVPRAALLDAVGGAEDLISRPIDARLPAMQHLRRYLRLLLEPAAIEDDALLHDHIETTLLDLIALALGTARERADVARLRGRRAARLRGVLGAIASGFDARDFSVNVVADRVGLSPRYVQDLLHETGRSFTARVLERRLQKARKLLSDPRFAARTITDIAFDSGFNDVSYFNRSFRRRFGVTPSDVRVPAAVKLPTRSPWDE